MCAATATLPQPTSPTRSLGWPLMHPTRVRSLAEARRELRIPNSSEWEGLQLWGTPNDFQLAVDPVAEPEQPDLVAEFALLRVVKRHGSRAVFGETHTRRRAG